MARIHDIRTRVEEDPNFPFTFRHIPGAVPRNFFLLLRYWWVLRREDRWLRKVNKRIRRELKKLPPYNFDGGDIGQL